MPQYIYVNISQYVSIGHRDNSITSIQIVSKLHLFEGLIVNIVIKEEWKRHNSRQAVEGLQTRETAGER